MPNLAKTLKEEISRISRHEAKVAVGPIRKPAIKLRRDVADLKVRLALIEKAHKKLHVMVAKIQAVQPATPVPEPATKGWISGKGIKTLRKRLGLSQNDFAKLVGVSSQAVTLWEGKPGMLKFRDATKAAVFAVRDLGAREARQRLESMTVAAAKKAGKAKAKENKTPSKQRK